MTKPAAALSLFRLAISTIFRVSIGVDGAGGFSNGVIGVKGSGQLTDTFLLANHCQVEATASVRDALQTSLEQFLLPFTDTAYRAIRDGNFLEYQFFGRLDVGLEASLGFSGVFFGGMSGGELRRSFTSPIGSITAKAKPELDLSGSFTLSYQHEDAFRMVLSGMSDRSRLFVFKMDHSLLSAGLRASAGVSLNSAIELEVQVDNLISKAAAKLFAPVQDQTLRDALVTQFTSRIKSSKGELDKYIQEAERRINDQLQKLNKLKVSAGAAFERISEHTSLLSVDFDRTAPAEGYRRAVHGDMAGAFAQAGATLAPGSYTRAEIKRTTSLSFQLFETFNATSIRTYFEKSDLRYAGNGVFQLRFTTGIAAENSVFGHRKAIELYFEITATTATNGSISDRDINLHIKTTEQKNPDAARRTAGLLHLILRNTAYSGLDNTLTRALSLNPDVTVNLSLVFLSSAYRRLPFSAFDGNKPAPVQTADAGNYAAFVDAVDLIYAGGGFGSQGFPDDVAKFKNWARYNVTAIDRENADRPPNRHQRGNSNTESVWPQNPVDFPAFGVERNVRPTLVTFMLAAQQFMNFCEDLPGLAKDLDVASSREAVGRVLDAAKDLVKESGGRFPLFFTKPLVAALVSQSAGVVKDAQGPAGDMINDTFDICITIA